MNGTGTQVLSGSNTYSGGTTIQSGVLSISQDYNLGAVSGPLAITGGTLQSTASMTLNAGRAVTIGPSAGIDVASGTLIYARRHRRPPPGRGSLTKIGAGVLQLDGTNTYHRPDHRRSRHLGRHRHPGQPGHGPGRGTVAPGDNTGATNFGGVGTLTVGALTLDSGAVADFDLGTSSDLLAVSGT